MFTATLLGNLKQKQTFSETKVENKKILSFLQNYVCDHNILKYRS